MLSGINLFGVCVFCIIYSKNGASYLAAETVGECSAENRKGPHERDAGIDKYFKSKRAQTKHDRTELLCSRLSVSG